MELYQLLGNLDSYYQVKEFKDHCHNGLQVEGKQEVHKIACAVSASLATIEAAIEWGADALIVHHGLFWEKESVQVAGPLKKKLSLLLSSGVSLLAYHLPMDAHQECGNNWPAAKALGLVNLQGFGQYLGKDVGVMGTLEAVSGEQFLMRLTSYYGGAPKVVGPLDRVLAKVALISGGAHRSFREAIEAGADAFITGTADEPQWNMALEYERLFISVGHSASERVGPKALAMHLEKKWGFMTCFIEDNNPF